MALNFTGNSKRVRLHSSSSAFQASTALTILAWLRTTNKSTPDQIVFIAGGWGGSGGLIDCTQRHHDGGKFGFFLTTATTQTQIATLLPSDVNNKWYYYGFQVNFSDNLNDHRSWIGSQTAPAALQSNFDAVAGGTLKTLQTGSGTEPTVGSFCDGSWGSFQGDIGFFAIYDALLTEQQVQWCQFNPTAFPGCMGMWTFGWPQTTAKDISGNGLSSTKYGTPTNVTHPYMPYSRQRKRGGFHFVVAPWVLTPQHVAHAVAVGSPSIQEHSAHSPDDVDHSHAITEPSFVQQHQLGVDDAAHAHSVDSPSITEHSQHAPDDVDHAHAVAQPAITQQHQLSVDDVDHSHSVTEPAITQQHQLSVDDVDHSHSVTQPTITEQGQLIAEDVSHAHSVTEPTIIEASQLSADDVSHVHSVTQPTIQEHSQHAPADVSHAHAVTQPTIVQAHVLSVDPVTHAHSVEVVTLQLAGVLTPESVGHAHAAGSPTITEHSQHQPDDVDHAHSVSEPSGSVLYVITPDDVTHAHSITEPTFSYSSILQALDAIHAHAASSPTITEHSILAVDNATHAHIVGTPALVTQAIQIPGHLAVVLETTKRGIKLPARGGHIILRGGQ